MRFIIVVLVSCVAGVCHAADPLDDGPWLQVTTQNFVIRGSQSEKSMLEIARHAELLRSAALMLTNIQATTPGTDSVVYVVPEQTYVAIVGDDGTAGRFIGSTRQKTLLIRDSFPVDEDTVIKGLFIYDVLASQSTFTYPVWYMVGMANYFAGSELQVESLDIGSPSRYQVNHLLNRYWVSINEWIDGTTFRDLSADDQYAFGAQSWALIHYLHHAKDRRISLSEGLETLAKARRDGLDEMQSFQVAFEIDPYDLRSILKRYLRRECCTFYRIPRATLLPKFEPQVTRISRAEAALGLSLVALNFGKNDHAERLLEVAMENTSTRARALALSAVTIFGGNRDQLAEDRLSEATMLAPDDTHVNADVAAIRLQQAHTATDEKSRNAYLRDAQAHLAKAWRGGESSLEVQALSARINLMLGEKLDQSVRVLENAVLQARYSLRYRLYLAEAYATVRRVDEASAVADSILLSYNAPDTYIEAAQDLIRKLGEDHGE